MGFGKGDGIVYSHAAMLAYYRQGLSDPEIARKVGCTASNVYKWRKYNSLPPNVPAHGGYGRPPRKREEPLPEQTPAEPEPRSEEKEIRLRTECSSCIFCASLNHGTADTYCAYSLITGHARILLPERGDGVCPGFASAGVILGGEDP
ncbi:MAG: hypothetical protein IKE76_13990 [Clostridia bacterium]|nr:hypothetical protein [Clostridia bacterium]